MASTFAVTRKHLIFGLCLPLAVLLGYLLAEPYASSSLSILVIFFAILIVPIMMRWYHPLLIFSWNLAMQPAFLPGRPDLWMLMSVLGFCFVILNRSVDPEFQLINVPKLTTPVIVMAVVIVGTALATGGVGLRVFGSREVGGRNYVYLMSAIVGYFALSTRPIKPQHAPLALALFFLPGISHIFGLIASKLGPSGYFLLNFFISGAELDQPIADAGVDPGTHRLMGVSPAALCIFCWQLSRYGVTGILDLSRPWRLVVFIGTVMVGSFGGFRSMLILMMAIFVAMIYLERLWQTRAFLVLLVGVAIGLLGLILFARHLPFSIQRTISFLPIEVDPLARQTADISTQWRVDMWKAVSAQIPDYLWLGKGYSLSSSDLYMVEQGLTRGFTANWEGSALAGDYHSGPLTLIIPFGIWGVIAFGWLLYAGTRHLLDMYRNGSEELRGINRFLLALFVARILFFLVVFGAFFIELYYFVGVLGLSVALNTSANGAIATTEGRNEIDDGPK